MTLREFKDYIFDLTDLEQYELFSYWIEHLEPNSIDVDLADRLRDQLGDFLDEAFFEGIENREH